MRNYTVIVRHIGQSNASERPEYMPFTMLKIIINKCVDNITNETSRNMLT